ncbi:MAG: FAD-dependent oxidoreductase [Solirubrobacteraceae bacterium]
MGHELGILGAGASGLSLALLTDLDHLVVEKAQRAGGHAVSTSIDGWTFDRGPHIMFSRNQLLLECMIGSLGDNVHRCRRNNAVAVAGVQARYPIENDLAALPHPLRADALISLLAAQAAGGDAHNLAEWFVMNFGEVLVSTYFRPYNEKVWNVPLEALSMDWANRIPRPPQADVIRGAVGEQSEGYLHQLWYSYPLRGGYAAIMEAWTAGVSDERLLLGSHVQSVRSGRGGVVVGTSTGEQVFERVVSTLPLRHLVNMVPGVPSTVRDAVSRLVVNSMVVVTLGFEGEDPDQYTAVYIPDNDFIVNRVSYPAVFSPHNAPAGCFSIQAEITTPRGSEILSRSDDAIVDEVVKGLGGRGLVPAGAELVFTWVERFEHAYVVYTQGYRSDLQLAVEWFATQGIILHGRFGAHQYVNVDGCLEQSIALARTLGAELTDAEIKGRFEHLGHVAGVAA